jgi:hypothetical protein
MAHSSVGDFSDHFSASPVNPPASTSKILLLTTDVGALLVCFSAGSDDSVAFGAASLVTIQSPNSIDSEVHRPKTKNLEFVFQDSCDAVYGSMHGSWTKLNKFMFLPNFEKWFLEGLSYTVGR